MSMKIKKYGKVIVNSNDTIEILDFHINCGGEMFDKNKFARRVLLHTRGIINKNLLKIIDKHGKI